MADDQHPGSQAQSDLYAAATHWRKHIAHRTAPQASEAVDRSPDLQGKPVDKSADLQGCASEAVLPAPCHDLRYHDMYRVGWNRCLDECRAALSAQPGAQKEQSDA